MAIVNVVPSNTMTLIRYVIVFVLDSINGSVSFKYDDIDKICNCFCFGQH